MTETLRQGWMGRVAWVCMALLVPVTVLAQEEVKSPHADWTNLASGKVARLKPVSNYDLTKDVDDARQLTDGKFSPENPIWFNKATVGWVGQRPEITIDLAKDEPIRGVALHMAAGEAGVEWPKSIEIFVSQDGKKFTPVGDLIQMLDEPLPEGPGYHAHWVATSKLQTHGRYVKLICTPQGKGQEMYIFLDEMEIYRGEDAWLKEAVSRIDAPRQWRAALDKIDWSEDSTGIADAELPRTVQVIDGKNLYDDSRPTHEARVGDAKASFFLRGEASFPRRMSWVGKLEQPVSLENCRFLLLEFRARGIRRTFDNAPLVQLLGVSNGSDEGSVVVLTTRVPLNDGRAHTLLMPMPAGFLVNQVKVSVLSEDDEAELTLQRLEGLAEAPDVYSDEIVVKAGSPGEGWAPVRMEGAFNGSLKEFAAEALAQHKVVLDGAKALAAGNVTVSGVPFVIGSQRNLALLPQSRPEEGQVEFLGEMVHKQFLEPTSRDDSLAIPVNARAREAFVLLAVSAPSFQELGSQPHLPMKLDDIEVLSVELTYDRGAGEVAFLYSMADQGTYIPARGLGAYAVAVDPSRRLSRITLRTNRFGVNFGVAAVTLNVSEQPRVPALADVSPPERTRVNEAPAERKLAVSHEGDRLTFANRWYECAINLSEGFSIERYVNRWNQEAKFALDGSSGLRVRVGDMVYTGRSFKSQVLEVKEGVVRLKLTSTSPSLPAEIELVIRADESPDLAFVATMHNRGEDVLSVSLSVPAMAELSIDAAERTRFFFPQYRAVDDGRPMALRAPYGPEFTQQYMDVYSRSAGVGVMVRSDNAQQQMADFVLQKDESGVSAGVYFPAQHNAIQPGESRAYVPVSLVAHNGDWRGALAAHREWLRGWYKPFRSQDKAFFLNAWEIAVYRPSAKLSWSEAKVPPPINADRTRWMIDQIFEFEKKARGYVPDIVHFYNWTYNDKLDREERGVFGTDVAYAQVGGLAFFRKGIQHIQQDWGVPVSLFTLSDRFRPSSLPDPQFARKMSEEAMGKALDGDAGSGLRGAVADGIYYVQIGNPQWLDFTINDIVKMQRDTGCKLVYHDVFSNWSHLPTYPGTTPRSVDLDVLQRFKKLLPEDVALWSEYPPTDYATQWEDGAIHYYFMQLHELFARAYNVGDPGGEVNRSVPFAADRFIQTRFKLVGLAAYIEATYKPSQTDALLINGEIMHENTWRLVESRLRRKLTRAHQIKHAYNDCFMTDDPSPHVDTEAQGLTANLFPGKNRNLWTIFNGRPKTYSGAVIRVPHREGARYRDVYNDKPLTPQIKDGVAILTLSIDTQQPGCIVQEWK